jgi:calcineurin-like phosphoesterase family protein
MKTWITSDHHFGHKNILTFKDDEGNLIRPKFSNVVEMNEYMVEMWNQYIKPEDKVYHLGDIIMSESATAIDMIMNQLNGRKVLIRGNHDNAKLSVYARHFKDIRGSHSLRGKYNARFILSHIPLHPSSLGEYTINLHGHTHQRQLSDAMKYLNMCVEVTSYMPIDFDSIADFFYVERN